MKLRHGSFMIVVTTAATILCSVPSHVASAKEHKASAERVWSFDKNSVGSVPKQWKVAETGGVGNMATWQVVADTSAPSKPNVMAITKNKNHGSTFNLLLAKRTSYKDLAINLKVKARIGKGDQGGGPVWRAKDADNYYVARWNPLEDNFRVYYVKNGRRKQIGTANVKTDPSVWHEIGIRDNGNKIEAKFDGKTLIEIEDSTFTESGMVGLWTKADAASSFDDFAIEPIGANEHEWSFENAKVGTLPKGWKVEATTKSAEPLATWQIDRDATAPDGKNVLTLTSPNHKSRSTFNLCWTNAVRFKDGEITLQLRGNTGKTDQGGGPMWRVKDKNNYYVCRANPLEDNFRLYRVKNGKRSQIAGADIKMPTGKWHEIAIKQNGTHIECFFNGKKLIAVDDNTFTESGGVGIWTKSDAASSFDKFEVKPAADNDTGESIVGDAGK